MKSRLLSILSLLFFATVIVTLILHLSYPTFHFVNPPPFRGNTLSNPYENVDFSKPEIVNFHGHTKAWGGLTNGKYTQAFASKRYDSLGYTLTYISQYHKIEKPVKAENEFSVYEHGINVKKTHQLILGNRDVVWKDYLLPQNRHQKKHILNLLASDTNNIVVLNHPGIRGGYTLDDMKYLQNYDMIEVLRPNGNFMAYLDTALSYGHPVSIMANDDFHNVANNKEVGNCLTIVYTSNEKKRYSVLLSMKKRRTAAVQLNQNLNSNLKERAAKISRMQKLIQSISLAKDTITIAVNEPMQITWKGQAGSIKTVKNKTVDKLIFPATETYVRLELTTHDNIVIFLNPIIRTESDKIPSRATLASTYTKKDKIFLATLINNPYMLLTTLILLFWKSLFKKKER